MGAKNSRFFLIPIGAYGTLVHVQVTPNGRLSEEAMKPIFPTKNS